MFWWKPTSFVRDQVLRAVVDQRDPGLLLHEDLLGLQEVLGALLEIGLLGGLVLHEVVELGVLPLAVVEALVVALEQEQEVLRVGVVADPAVAGDVEIAAVAQMREMRLRVGVDERGLDAEGLPLVGDRDDRVPVVVRRVVADLDLQRLAAGTEAGLLEERLGLVLAVDRRQRLVLGLRRLAVIADARGHERVGRQHGARPRSAPR